MRIAIYVYMAFFFLFSASVLFDDFKDKSPRWEIVTDLLLLPAGFAGMAFYQFGVEASALKMIWKAVSVLLLAGHVYSDLKSSRQMLAGAGPGEISKRAVIAADLTSVVLIMPALVINFLFAYSEHLR